MVHKLSYRVDVGGHRQAPPPLGSAEDDERRAERGGHGFTEAGVAVIIQPTIRNHEERSDIIPVSDKTATVSTASMSARKSFFKNEISPGLDQ